ncbi:MAG: hypothetical protein ABI600_15820 [Luteolibacter sp.]
MPHKNTKGSAGMTLMETVIAIGVIAVAIPLILAASTASLTDRRNAEADTRAAWLSKDVENQIAALWATPRRYSYLPQSLTLRFPDIGTEKDPTLLIYDRDAKFVSEGSKSDLQSGVKAQAAQFLVTIYSKSQITNNLTSSTTELSRIYIQVQYPAKSPPANRQSSEFSLVTPKQQPF